MTLSWSLFNYEDDARSNKHKMYIDTLSLISAIVSGGWLKPRPGRFTPGKVTRYPLYTLLGGALRPACTGAENSPEMIPVMITLMISTAGGSVMVGMINVHC